MKLAFALLMVFGLGVSTAKAQIEPMSLKSVMKTMGTQLKTLAAQAKTPAKNPQSAALADQLATNAVASKTFVPASVASLPVSQQAAAKAEYERMLDETAKLSQELAAAFRANDNAQAVQLINDLSQNKSDGHDMFK